MTTIPDSFFNVGLDAFENAFDFTVLDEVYESAVKPKGGYGIDRVGITAFNEQKNSQLQIAERKCQDGTYKFSPYLQRLILRDASRPPRQLSLPTIRDRVVLHCLKKRLTDIFSVRIERRLPNEFIREIKSFAQTVRLDDFFIIRADISSFYDEIQHDILLQQLQVDLQCQQTIELTRRAIRTPTLPLHTLRKDRRGKSNRKGVPQGLPISNILAAIYLTKFDERMKAQSSLYLRYVDDIIMLVPTSQAEAAFALLQGELATLGLKCNQKKTKIVPATHQVEYLSYSLSLPRISIKDTSIQKFIRAVAAKISTYRYRTLEGKHPKWLPPQERIQAFTEELNEKITGAISENRRYGWLFYFLETNDLSLLYRTDITIRDMLQRVAELSNIPMSGLKRLTRAYYEARHSPDGGYIHDYNAITTRAHKARFLVRRGIESAVNIDFMTDQQVDDMFDREKRKRLNELEMDIGFLY